MSTCFDPRRLDQRKLERRLRRGGPAARKVLNIEELLCAVLYCLRPEWMNPLVDEQERNLRLAALARFARVSKHFEPLASTLLWEEQHGLGVFFATFDKLEYSEASTLRLRQRVKKLIYPGSNPRQDCQALVSIYALLKGKPLFPYLQTLRLEQGYWPLTPTEASLLFSYQLTTLRIVYRPQAHGQRTISWGRWHTIAQQRQACIHKLAERSPNLRVCCIITTRECSEGTCFDSPISTTSVLIVQPTQDTDKMLFSIASGSDRIDHGPNFSAQLAFIAKRKILAPLTISVTLFTALPIYVALHFLHPFNNAVDPLYDPSHPDQYPILLANTLDELKKELAQLAMTKSDRGPIIIKNQVRSYADFINRTLVMTSTLCTKSHRYHGDGQYRDAVPKDTFDYALQLEQKLRALSDLSMALATPTLTTEDRPHHEKPNHNSDERRRKRNRGRSRLKQNQTYTFKQSRLQLREVVLNRVPPETLSTLSKDQYRYKEQNYPSRRRRKHKGRQPTHPEQAQIRQPERPPEKYRRRQQGNNFIMQPRKRS